MNHEQFPAADDAEKKERLEKALRLVLAEVGRIEDTVKPTIDTASSPSNSTSDRSRSYFSEVGRGAALRIIDFRTTRQVYSSTWEYLPGDRRILIAVFIKDPVSGQAADVEYEIVVRDGNVLHTNQTVSLKNEDAVDEMVKRGLSPEDLSTEQVAAVSSEFFNVGEISELSCEKMLEMLHQIS